MLVNAVIIINSYKITQTQLVEYIGTQIKITKINYPICLSIIPITTVIAVLTKNSHERAQTQLNTQITII